MKVKVINNGSNPLILRGPEGEILLMRGANEVDGKKLGKILQGAKAQRIFEASCQLLKEQPKPVLEAAPESGPVDITRLSYMAAKKLIAETTNVDQLDKWAYEDSRESVRKALHYRHRDIMPREPEADQGD